MGSSTLLRVTKHLRDSHAQMTMLSVRINDQQEATQKTPKGCTYSADHQERLKEQHRPAQGIVFKG
ncbi:hypothetical protein [Thaumasiovibrio sp. DFM-14]|uniref:hypothetical protein n=1 Tax=Thaumasiovibrio sp. DFM-14 TaxID=3384792 RepID=UPI0039A15D06